ncbi:MAG: T9SS C-terminal target domain-containing protein [Cytophagales bacterium]|nr:MAG: T9SS C-terminal target domain-containing protein [Cytophagales bacterium]
MKVFLFFSIFAMSLNGHSQYINSQLNSSQRSIGHEVIYAQNDSWIVASESNRKLSFSKIDNAGNNIWNKTIDIKYTEQYSLAKTILRPNGNYIFAGIAESTCDVLIYVMFVIELSNQGEIVMQAEYQVNYSKPVFVFEDLYQDLVVIQDNKIFTVTNNQIVIKKEFKDYYFTEVVQKNGYLYYGKSFNEIVQFDKDGEIITTRETANPSNLFVLNNTVVYLTNNFMYSYDDESIVRDSTFRGAEIPKSILNYNNELWINYSNKIVWMDNFFRIKNVWDLTKIQNLDIYSIGLSPKNVFFAGTKSAFNNNGIALIAFKKNDNLIKILDNVRIENIILSDVSHVSGINQYGGKILYVSHRTKMIVRNSGPTALKNFYIHYRLERVNLSDFCSGMEEVTKKIENVTLFTNDTLEIDLGIIFRSIPSFENDRFNFCASVSAPNNKINSSKNDYFCKLYQFDPLEYSAPESEILFTLYPNPATIIVHINTKQNLGGSLVIFNAFGQQILEKPIVSEIIDCDIENLTKGFYIVELLRQNGSFAGRHKLVVQ